MKTQALLATALAVGLGTVGRDHRPPAQDTEPPLRMTLEVEGNNIDVELDKPFTVSVGGKKIAMKLVAKPTLHFAYGGIEFDYPRSYSFESHQQAGISLWVLDGNDCTLTVHKYGASDPARMLAAVIRATIAEYGDSKVDQGACSIQLGANKLDGTRLDVSLAGTEIRQDFYAFRGADATYVMIVQDTPGDDGKTSADTANALAMLSKTFAVSK